MRDPTRRFSDRVADYVLARPSYPHELIDRLRGSCGLAPSWIVADVGSGSGNLARLFLDAGNRVCGVEPNREMRLAAERSLEGHPRFRSVDGRAEWTGLGTASVDLVAAGQSFHWFDRRRARVEFARILRPGGPVVLVWNDRHEDAGPLMRGYERLLRRYGTDYGQVRRRRPTAAEIERFFGASTVVTFRLPHAQLLDREGLRARVRSSSYVPAPGRAGHRELLAAVDRLFERHEREGRVTVDYATLVYVGRLEVTE
jgi:SAM-dependent methyltransferase